MELTEYIDADNLSIEFLNYLKATFKGKKIRVNVMETELDATEYLMSSPANHQRLLNSIKNIEKGENLIPLDEALIKKLTS
jgi:hypothetical protein